MHCSRCFYAFSFFSRMCGRMQFFSHHVPIAGLHFRPRRAFSNWGWTFWFPRGIMPFVDAGIVHRLVYQPSKLRRWVRFPLPAPSVFGVDSFRINAFSYVLTQFLAQFLIFNLKKRFKKTQRYHHFHWHKHCPLLLHLQLHNNLNTFPVYAHSLFLKNSAFAIYF